MAKIKICGLRRDEDVAIVNQYLPDYAGFILAEGRRRTITPEQAKHLKEQLHPSIQAVGVFVNQDPDWICELYEQGVMEVIQLHGAEDVQTAEAIKQRTGAVVVKALSVKDGTEADRWQGSSVDYLLLDNGIGGTGETFDWSLFTRLAKGIPFFIAGGIGADNVSQVLQKFAPYAVDVSGGVETDGVKDGSKVEMLVRMVREA